MGTSITCIAVLVALAFAVRRICRALELTIRSGRS